MATADSVKTKLQGLIDKANGITGGADTTLTGAVDTLAAGYGQGADPTLTEITITENGEYTPDEGVDGFGKVTVGVESGGGGMDMVHYMSTLSNAFSGVTFPDDTELDLYPGKYSGRDLGACAAVFTGSVGPKKIKISCNEQTASVSFSKAFSLNGTDTGGLETIDLTGFKAPLSNMQQCFAWRTSLKEILGELDCTGNTTFNSAFLVCTALETIKFKAGSIGVNLNIANAQKLTAESIQSIIDGLADLTGGTAQTLTLHATVGAKLTDEQKAAASAKNWTISY